MFEILLPAFLLSVVLLGIHSYFGLEIIKRGIIFTDLAVGQMAALGAAVSLFFWEGTNIYFVSLAFALFGGFLIAVVTHKTDKPEAFIGLLYAMGISGVFILLSKSPHGMEEFQNLMAADILFTPMEEIIKVGLLYSVLGTILYFSNKKSSGFLKELIFFTIFSITVTSSVKLAGVLIIFSLLIAPALIALTVNRFNPVLFAWITGIIVNIVSIWISYNYDLPTGYTIVFCHSLSAGLIYIFSTKKSVSDAL